MKNEAVNDIDTTSEHDSEPIPEDAQCPECGAEPTDETKVKHRLSDMGYLHDDISFDCANCDNSWVHGVPSGDYDAELDEELRCNSCERTYMMVHRINIRENDVLLDLKCPNCYYFTRSSREPDDSGTALVGYGAITGELNEDRPIGFTL